MSEDIIIDLGFSKVTITVEQQANLRKLAEHLLTLPAEYPSFAMSRFTNDGAGFGDDEVHVAECGTAACAVGHAPMIGFEPLEGEYWSPYSERLFIEHCHLEPWEWCFGAKWSEVDNTAHGAAYRILWLLENRGIPDNANRQRWGRDPISYWPATAEPA